MAVLKCKMCGGDISVSADKSVGTCNYCGSIMTIPKVDNERTANLFNRANYYRLQGDFERALVSYENILAEDSMNPEAYWCSVLCRYGVEYVDDPNTHQKIPTCHRASYESIFDDLDYKKAVSYAGPIAKELYEKEAKQIDEIQKGILAISKLEAPYDIFISYKESDEAGARTKDSVLAQDLYSRLTKEGYRTFFSRISLEDKLGQQYEPYIFSALNTAKVMLVVGTSQDHFNAPWVKNEWGRFLALMKGDSNRILIPCYRDMNVYDLPEELSMFQCQDMGKIGFEQDLLHGISKVLGNAKQHVENSETFISAASPDSLLKRGKMFLTDCDWTSAENYFDRVLDLVPECAEAYAGKLCVMSKAISVDMLGKAYLAEVKSHLTPYRETPPPAALASYPDYKRAIQFADSSLRQTLEAEEKYANEHIVAELEENLQVLGDDIIKQESIVSSKSHYIMSIKKEIEEQEKSLADKTLEGKRLTQKSDRIEMAFVAIAIIISIIDVVTTKMERTSPFSFFDWIIIILGFGLYIGIAILVSGIFTRRYACELKENEKEKAEQLEKIRKTKNRVRDLERELNETQKGVAKVEHIKKLRQQEIASYNNK